MGNLLNPFILSSAAPAIITTNRVFDFDADLGVTTDGDGVTNWADQDSNVGDLFAESATRSPALITNGNPGGNGDAIEFDGNANRAKVTGGFTFNQPETIYLVLRANAWAVNDTFVDGNILIAMQFLQSPTTPTVRIRSVTSLVADNSDLSLNTWGIYCLIFNGANSSIRLNNNTKTTGNPGSVNAEGLTVGSAQNNTSFANFRVARILGYDTAAHSDAEQDQNIDALNDIYSVF